MFMVGFRVFDVGLLVVWLIWFFRLRDDGDDPPGEDGGGGEGPDPGPGRDGPGGDGIRLPLGRWPLGHGRDRDHSSPGTPRRRRGGELVPGPLPSRVRRPGPPVPARHRG
jgi:hypothetical protein